MGYKGQTFVLSRCLAGWLQEVHTGNDLQIQQDKGNHDQQKACL